MNDGERFTKKLTEEDMKKQPKEDEKKAYRRSQPREHILSITYLIEII